MLRSPCRLGSGVIGNPRAFGALSFRFESGLPSTPWSEGRFEGVASCLFRPISELVFASMPGFKPTFTEEQMRAAVAASSSYTDVLRQLGLRTGGGNWRTVRRYIDHVWRIPTDHFDPNAARRAALRAANAPRPLEEILVEHSTYSRGALKQRLYRAGLKQPVCEECGQGEVWQGRRMALILDHINGRATDHRLENLRIVCPNCAATLDTHCGKLARRRRTERPCAHCGTRFYPDYEERRFCSRACSQAAQEGRPQRERRLVERPPYRQLLEEVRELGWCGTGRRYGVSDNAIRKWMRQYQREAALREAEALRRDEEAGEEAA